MCHIFVSYKVVLYNFMSYKFMSCKFVSCSFAAVWPVVFGSCIFRALWAESSTRLVRLKPKGLDPEPPATTKILYHFWAPKGNREKRRTK